MFPKNRLVIVAGMVGRLLDTNLHKSNERNTAFSTLSGALSHCFVSYCCFCCFFALFFFYIVFSNLVLAPQAEKVSVGGAAQKKINELTREFFYLYVLSSKCNPM